MITTFYGFGDAQPVSPAHALITLWLKAGSGAGADELAAAYFPCLKHAVHGFAPYDHETRRRFRVLFLNQLQILRERLPPATLARTVREMLRTDGPEVEAKEDLLALTHAICPGLLP
jgi:hypothetical protein